MSTSSLHAHGYRHGCAPLGTQGTYMNLYRDGGGWGERETDTDRKIETERRWRQRDRDREIRTIALNLLLNSPPQAAPHRFFSATDIHLGSFPSRISPHTALSLSLYLAFVRGKHPWTPAQEDLETP